MAIRYYKLFDLMNRRDITKNDLREIVSPNTVAKLTKGKNVTTDIIDKICLFLGCQPGDIMEVVIEKDLPEENYKMRKKSRLKYDIDENGKEVVYPVTDILIDDGDPFPVLVNSTDPDNFEDGDVPIPNDIGLDMD